MKTADLVAVPDVRRDVHTGASTHVVASRQVRPNLPEEACPFCVGGLEAPDPYDVRWFENRWPPMPNRSCEVILYTPEHDAPFSSLGAEHARKVVDLWAERSAELGARPDVAYVLVFENRGAAVGATIDHPHGQIYYFPEIPPQPRRELELGEVFPDPGDRIVASADGWRGWVPEAPVFPYAVTLVSEEPVQDLPSLDDQGRNGLAEILVDVRGRFANLFDEEPPTMMWIHQRPFDGRPWPQARLHVEIVTPWRALGVMRYIAAGEIGSGVYFNPIPPEAAAQSLRDAKTRGRA
jgi:UDPglucose--hexose-1-phosphate uridylyltransferase